VKQITLTANGSPKSIGVAGRQRRSAVFIGVDATPTNLGTGVVQVLYKDGAGAWQLYQGVGSALVGLKAGEQMVYEAVDMELGVQLSGASASPSVAVNNGSGEG
jgi:hypothetical protein